MKKIIVSILIVVCLIIFVLSIKVGGYTANSKMINFSNDFFGLSLLYPEYLDNDQPTVLFSREPEETVLFTYNKEEIFRINLEYEKFDEDNRSEYLFPEEKTKFKKIKPLSFVKEALAMAPPEPVKMDVNKVIFGDNTFYTYAYSLNGKRVDKFFIPQEFNTIVFIFYNQKEQFIKNILSSIKRIDGIYSSEGKQIIKNENIGLERIDIPRNWLVTNDSTSTVIEHHSQNSDINVLITNYDTGKNLISQNLENLNNSHLDTLTQNSFTRYSNGLNQLYLNDGNNFSGGLLGSDNGFEIQYKVNGKKLFFYSSVILNKGGSSDGDIEKIYLIEILNSIIVSNSDTFKNEQKTNGFETKSRYVIFKMKPEYFDKVFVTVNVNKEIIAFNGAGNIASPSKLDNGYFLNGMKGNAVLSISISDFDNSKDWGKYINKEYIIDYDPFLEVYDC